MKKSTNLDAGSVSVPFPEIMGRPGGLSKMYQKIDKKIDKKNLKLLLAYNINILVFYLIMC